MVDLLARQPSASLLVKAQIAARYGSTGVTAPSTTKADAATPARSTTSAQTNGDAATISPAARRAAAQIADARKDFGALAKDVRATLDAQQSGRPATVASTLDELSGRALAAIVLNQGGGFSRTEMVAARAELQSRERQGVTEAMRGYGSTAGLATYSQGLVTDYDRMSNEERQARGWTDRTRSAAAALVARTMAGTLPSLFDQLG